MNPLKSILKCIEENESLSVLSRFYAKIIKDKIQKIEEKKEKPNIVFINKKFKK